MQHTDLQRQGLNQVSISLKELNEVAALARGVYADSIVTMAGAAHAPNLKALASKVASAEQIDQISAGMVQTLVMSPSSIPEICNGLAAGIAQIASLLGKAKDNDEIVKEMASQLTDPFRLILSPLIDVTRAIRFNGSKPLDSFKAHFGNAENFCRIYKDAFAEMEKRSKAAPQSINDSILKAFERLYPGREGQELASITIEALQKTGFFEQLSSLSGLNRKHTIIDAVAQGLYSPASADGEIDRSIDEKLTQRLGAIDAALVQKLAQCSSHFSLTVPDYFSQNDRKHAKSLAPNLLPLIEKLPAFFVKVLDKFLDPQKSLAENEINFLKGALLLSKKRNESLDQIIDSASRIPELKEKATQLIETKKLSKPFEDLLAEIIEKRLS
jgi:hypothetical protein